jgi:hypothetical protein
MHSVQWTNPDWKTTWGLGFFVDNKGDGNAWVGHDGSCPEYRTVLEINLKNKLAYAIMINANRTNPAKYGNGLDAIINNV